MEHIVEQDLELQAVIGFQGKSTSQETLSFLVDYYGLKWRASCD